MKSLVLTATCAAFLISATGCTTISKTDRMLQNAAMSAKRQEVATTPLWTSLDMDETSEVGRASETSILSLFKTGDTAKISIPVGEFLSFVLGGVDLEQLTHLERIAASRAIDNAGADGLYVTRAETAKYGIPFIWRTTEVTVTGKPVSIVVFGPENPLLNEEGEATIDYKGEEITIRHNNSYKSDIVKITLGGEEEE